MIRDPLLVLTFMLAIIAFARILEERIAFVKKITSAVVCTLLGIFFANIGVIEHTGPVHEAVSTYAIPYAIVLIIMGTDMRELKNAGWPMIIAYGAACLGSVVGGVVGGLSTAEFVGPETWKLSGAFAAAFMGGGLNFAAISFEFLAKRETGNPKTNHMMMSFDTMMSPNISIYPTINWFVIDT